VLVNSLLLPRAREIRPTVVEALRRLGDERVPDRIALALTDADEEQRVSLLTAIGQLDAAAAASPGRRYLADPSPRVRTVAAQALGLGARTMRRAGPDAEPEGRRELEILLRDARSENEIKAALWALAQLDQPEAWAVVRKAAVEDEREFARRYASRYLKFPRQRLILEPD
jgi:HEAT repeat protein